MFYQYKKNDEYKTPDYAVFPILKYIKPKSKILCPFDSNDSNFVKILSQAGHMVIHTHICEGKNFLKLKDANVDYIISNPPYSIKTQVIEKLYELKKPFMMLMNLSGIFESKRFYMFKNNGVEPLVFNKRICFINDQGEMFCPPFSSGYVCYNVLSEKIVFEELKHTDKKEIYGDCT